MALFPLMRPGDNVVASTRLYGGTYTQFTHTIKRFGWSAEFVDFDDLSALEDHIDDRTRAIFCESISNPAATSPTSRGVRDRAARTACR
jgi:O-acetylhomoserine (thiol)-lyase